MSYGTAGLVGFGGIRNTFSAQAVWADAQLAATAGNYAHLLHNCAPSLATDEVSKKMCVYAKSQIASAEAAGIRATTQIQEGLTELGISPGVIDGKWGPNTQGAWDKFKASKGRAVGAKPGVTLQALQDMEASLKGVSVLPAVVAPDASAAAAPSSDASWWSKQDDNTKIAVGVGAAVAVGLVAYSFGVFGNQGSRR